MYISKNIFETKCRFVDMPEIEFFNLLITNAINLFHKIEEDGIIVSDKVDKIKKTMTPVIYASTVKNFKKSEDSIITRIDLNKRIKCRYFFIDCDFNNGEEEISINFRKKLINFAKEMNTPIIIYPSISYPNKPRYRVVFFTKKLMDENDYYKCVKWFYGKIGEEPKDAFDLSIKHTNNAPIFINEPQIRNIFNTSLSKKLKPLDNSLWKDVKGKNTKKISKAIKESFEFFDKIEVDGEKFLEATTDFSLSEKAKNYSTFSPLLYSIARAELVGQISSEIAEKALVICANAAEDEYTKEHWINDNLSTYNKVLEKMNTDDETFNNAFPILYRNDFKKVWCL